MTVVIISHNFTVMHVYYFERGTKEGCRESQFSHGLAYNRYSSSDVIVNMLCFW